MTATASNSSLPSASLISTQALMGIRDLELRARRRRSAELHSAVPPTCSRQSRRETTDVSFASTLRRLQTCDTAD